MREKLRLPLAIRPRCWRLIPLSKESLFLVKEVAPCICAKSSISAFRMTSMSYRIFQFYEYVQKIVQTIVSIFFVFFAENIKKHPNKKGAPQRTPRTVLTCRFSSARLQSPILKEGRQSNQFVSEIKLGSKALASIPKNKSNKILRYRQDV